MSKNKPNKISEQKSLTEGWTSELLEALINYSSERGLGFPSKDYVVYVDGLVFESNNFEVERKAYGSILLLVGESSMQVNIPVVIYFVLPDEDDDGHQYFKNKIKSKDIYLPNEENKVYGKAVLNEYHISTSPSNRNLLPIFEWFLFLDAYEWSVINQIIEIADDKNPPKVSIRVGFPPNITKDTIVNDSINTRLLIYRLWFDTIRTYATDSLSQNQAFKFDNS